MKIKAQVLYLLAALDNSCISKTAKCSFNKSQQTLPFPLRPYLATKRRKLPDSDLFPRLPQPHSVRSPMQGTKTGHAQTTQGTLDQAD